MRHADIIAKMTLEEKAAVLSGGGQFYSQAVPRVGLEAMHFADGPHGVRKQAGNGDHLGLQASLPATCFPTAAGVANTWNTELGETLGTYLGTEAKSLGINMLLGPGLNIKRSPLCGRNFEYFSEDPYLSGKMAAAYIRGIQSQGVSACPKHYAVNNQETLRQHNDSVLDERTLREIYLTGFEIAVTEGKPLGIMSSYNKVNGVYASECPKLLTDILVKEWGFEGLVVTDWGGSNDRVEAARAGGHLEMPTTAFDSDDEVVRAVRAGKLAEAQVDRLVDAYLHVLAQTKLDATPSYDQAKHHKFAVQVAGESIVLLKNQGDILPLNKSAKVAVIGDFADTPRYQGFGSSVINPTQLDRPLDALAAVGLSVTYCKGFERDGKSNPTLKQEAVRAAKSADVVLMYMGLDEMSEAEGVDRAHMNLHKNQAKLLAEVSNANPNVVVVLCGGAPFEMPWIDQAKAVIHGYLGGQAGATAMAQALVGQINPSGKLAETWASTYDQTPAYNYYPGKERTSEYREGLFVGYRYYDANQTPVRFAFGHGLSYTSFAYSDLTVTGDTLTFTVTNTGTRDGAEVSQVYISHDKSSFFRAPQELKGFAKTMLKAGERKQVSIRLDDKALRYFNITTNQFEIEQGDYTISVGASSRDIKLSATHHVAGTTTINPYADMELPAYTSGNIQQVSDAEFERLLGRPIPPSRWNRSALLGPNDTFSQLFYAKGWVGRLTHKILVSKKNKAEREGKPVLDILFIYNMPFRAIAKNAGVFVSPEMADGVLMIFNGKFWRGLGKLTGGYFRKRKLQRKYTGIIVQFDSTNQK